MAFEPTVILRPAASPVAVSDGELAMQAPVARSDSRASGRSTVSLTRRPATRTRSRTLTSSPRVQQPTSSRPATADAYAPNPPPMPSSSQPMPQPNRPPRSPMRVATMPPHAEFPQMQSQAQQIAAQETQKQRASEELDDPRIGRAGRDDRESKARKRCSSVPREYRFSMQSSNLSDPTSPLFPNHSGMHPMPPYNSIFLPRDRARDSILTEQSGNSSSIYPPSSSTASAASGTDWPPSPPSDFDHHFQSNHVMSLDSGEQDDLLAFKTDDVAYRLRLLVNNNYFLPPAHSKPSPLDLASPRPHVEKKPSKQTGFFDLFRGKSKSKTTSPEPSPPIEHRPVLRTTSDSTTASGWIAPQSGQPVRSQPIPRSPLSAPQDRAGRVAVVREKVDNLELAVQQAEEDMKRATQDAQMDTVATFDEVIDPTDAVDVPVLSPDSPFAQQTSAMHGLGIEESVGAAVLADRLPPKHSDSSGGLWSLDSAEESWRKKLLQDAVGHSLTPSEATESLMSPPLKSPTPSSPLARTPVDPSPPRSSTVSAPEARNVVGQPILTPENYARESTRSPQQRRTSKSPRRWTPPRKFLTERQAASPALPERCDSPVTPAIPLAPAPRSKTLGSPSSQVELRPSSEDDRGVTSPHALRKAMSSPVLHESYSGSPRGRERFTPPPLPMGRLTPLGRPGTTLNHDRLPSSGRTSSSSLSRASLEDRPFPRPSEYNPRPSFAASLPSHTESDSSQPSPTASAFQDALFDPEQVSVSVHITRSANASSDSMHEPTSRPSFANANMNASVSSVSRSFRTALDEAPPRSSSSFGLNNTLRPPPPRHSALRSVSTASSSQPSLTSRASSEQGHSNYQSAMDVTESATVDMHIDILAPDPTTPPFPDVDDFASLAPVMPRGMSGRRTRASPLSSLQITSPSLNHPAIRSAPPPMNSPLEFFDYIQTHPDVMDDLESLDASSESEEDETSWMGSDADERRDEYTRTRATTITGPQPPSAYAYSTYPPPPSPGPIAGPSSTTAMRPPLSMSSLLQLQTRNHSSPNVSSPSLSGGFGGGGAPRASESSSSRAPNIASLVAAEKRKPVGNVPQKAQYFNKRKGEGVSNLDFLQRPATPEEDMVGESGMEVSTSMGTVGASSSAGTIGGSGGWLPGSVMRTGAGSGVGVGTRLGPPRRSSMESARSGNSKRESLIRLDGMLLRHMEAERTRMISLPLPLQKKTPTTAAITSVNVTSRPLTSSSRTQASPLHRFYYDVMDMKTAANTKHNSNNASVVTSVNAKRNKKRERQLDGDENESADRETTERTGVRPRVRQRLRSMSSVETIRAQSPERSEKFRLSHQSSTSTLRSPSRSTTPLGVLSDSSFNRSSSDSDPAVPTTGTPRTLRRVGAVIFKKSAETAPGLSCATPTTTISVTHSRIPRLAVKTHLLSSDLPPISDNDTSAARHTRRSPSSSHKSAMTSATSVMKRPMTVAEAMAELEAITRNHEEDEGCGSSEDGGEAGPPSPSVSHYAGGSSIGLATLKDRERYDLRCTLLKKHTDLWDMQDSAIHALEGLLLLTDYQFTPGSSHLPPPHTLNIQCQTHSYEGRFSSENNDLPVFSTEFLGQRLSKSVISSLLLDLASFNASTSGVGPAPALDFSPDSGIIVQKEWKSVTDSQDGKRQWYVKFWIPIPVTLFKKMETRMFTVKAKLMVVQHDVDGRGSWKTIPVLSTVAKGDISHLKKHKEMAAKKRQSP